MKSINISQILFLLAILAVLGIFYKWHEDKRLKEDDDFETDAVRKYLLNGEGVDLQNSIKPILWIHIPYEYNARKWKSFGSRSSSDLNQPYLYLCVKTIIEKCGDSFEICIIDDNAFPKLLPSWSIDMSKISKPIVNKMRMLGFAKLLHMYGGLLCPVSFLCLRNLDSLYNDATANGRKMFVAENVNRTVTSEVYQFSPQLNFAGSPKECPVLGEFIEFIQKTISQDSTEESHFLGLFSRWLKERVERGQVNMVDGTLVGVKDTNGDTIVVDDLMSQTYLKLDQKTYGILIPRMEIENRRNFEWFTRLSEKQVLESNTIIGNYLLLANVYTDAGDTGILEPAPEKEPKWTSFWKVPSGAPLWGNKPNFLGDNITQLKYPYN